MLKGVKVLEFSRVIAAPVSAMILGDLGAEVIKVEDPNGDISRYLGPRINEDYIMFDSLNRNKKGIVLNMRDEADKEAFYKLVEWADVFIENFRTDALENMQITYDDLKKINPRLIYCSVTSFGETGPYEKNPGLDSVYQALSGIMSITGETPERPLKVGTPIVDVAGGMTAALAISAALYQREKTGEGRKLTISLLDVAVFLQTPIFSSYFSTGEIPRQMGNSSIFAVGEDFVTKDSRIMISIPNDKFWRKLCTSLGREDLITHERYAKNEDRVKNMGELREILADAFKSKTSAEWLEILERDDIPASVIYNYSDVDKDPQLNYNGLFVPVPHKDLGELKTIATPISIDGQKYERERYRRAPHHGEHREEVLKMINEQKEQ